MISTEQAKSLVTAKGYDVASITLGFENAPINPAHPNSDTAARPVYNVITTTQCTGIKVDAVTGSLSTSFNICPVPAMSQTLVGNYFDVTGANLIASLVPISKYIISFTNPTVSVIAIIVLLLIIYLTVLIIRFIIWIIRKIFGRNKKGIENFNIK